MSKKIPLVSIGLPVYNGENFLHEALDSVLRQSYTNLEIIISDNASTDKTADICAEYLHKDKRIIYHRFEKNYGAAKNFNTTFKLSKGTYFKWMAHDDLINPNYIEGCVDVLEKHPDVCLAQTEKVYIYSDLTNGRASYRKMHLMQTDPRIRFSKFLQSTYFTKNDLDFVFGLFRASELAKSELIGNYNASDLTLLADMTLRGKFFVIPTFSFTRRLHPASSTNANPGRKARALWFDTSVKKIALIPHFIWFKKFLAYVSRTNLEPMKKMACYADSMIWLVLHLTHSATKKMKMKRHIKVLVN